MEVHRLRTGLTGLARDVFGTFDTHSSPHSEHRFPAPSSKTLPELVTARLKTKINKTKRVFVFIQNDFGFNHDGETRWAVIKETSAII